MTTVSTNHAVIIGQARFALLADGLVRLEYAPDGRFEDRTSVRALTRPEAQPFLDVTEADGVVLLRGPRCTVRYRPGDGPFTAENLQVLSPEGALIWRPGQVDTENLGGAHLAMDVIQRGVIPEGVHPASDALHENGAGQHLWGYIFGQPGTTVPDAHYSGGMKSLEQVLATTPFEQLPANIQALVTERRKYPPGLLSRAGYFLYNDSDTAVLNPETGWLEDRNRPESQDCYLFVYGTDYAGALRDYRALFGATPLIPRYSLGLWYSRYPTFNQDGLYDLVQEFARQDLPIDVLVLDLEWHLRGWYGWDWDRNHIPDPDKLLADLHADHIHVTMNVHPAGVPVEDSRFEQFVEEGGITVDREKINPEWPMFLDFDLADQRQAAAWMHALHEPVQRQGVDFWWIDGDGPVRSVKMDRQFWTNEVYQRSLRDTEPDRRSMIFSRTAGFGSHRYPFHFTGDTYCQWEVLESQVEYTLRAGHIGQSFVTHDISGHMSPFVFIDSELYVRWVQWGVLSPIFRLHSSGGGERRPWLYGEQVADTFRAAMRLRMELLPYLYTLAHESHAAGLPMCRSCALAMPEWEAGYGVWDAYFFGDRIFAAPIVGPGSYRRVLLPPGRWYDGKTGAVVESDGVTDFPILSGLNELPPHYLKAGSVLVKQPYTHRAGRIPETLVLELYPAGKPAEVPFALYEDDGLTRAHEGGACAVTRFTYTEDAAITLTIAAREGAFPEHPVARDYEVRVFGLPVPQITLNGQPITGEREEGKPYCTFRTPSLPTTAHHALHITTT